MAVSILAREVSDLCLGKPPLRSISVSATVADAVSALKRFGDSYLSVWSCNDHCGNTAAPISKIDVSGECRCIGKICMVDAICFLAKNESLKNPGKALQEPVSVLLPEAPGLVRHLEPQASLQEGIDLILGGTQNLVIPIRNRRARKQAHKAASNSTLHNNREYCWLGQEDIVRYLLNSIGIFSPVPYNSIESLNIIDSGSILSVHYNDPADTALPLITQSLINQTSVAILDEEGRLIGEISPSSLNFCEEGVAGAIATLSAGDLMAYIDCADPPEDLMQMVKERLEQRNLGAALELMEEESALSLSLSSSSLSCSSFSSSDDESGSGSGSGRSERFSGEATRVLRSADAIVCHPWSSLVAVMIQALSHRVSYAWVVEEDGTLAGVVTFAGIMKVLRERLKPIL